MSTRDLLLVFCLRGALTLSALFLGCKTYHGPNWYSLRNRRALVNENGASNLIYANDGSMSAYVIARVRARGLLKLWPRFRTFRNSRAFHVSVKIYENLSSTYFSAKMRVVLIIEGRFSFDLLNLSFKSFTIFKWVSYFYVITNHFPI